MSTNSGQYKRCPDCKALIQITVTDCPECRLVEKYRNDLIPESKIDGPKNSVARFIWGLGIPFDIWLVVSMGAFWFILLVSTETITTAVFLTIVGFGLPLMLIVASEEFSVISFVRVPLEAIEPIAIKIFAWVYMIGFQMWLIYNLTNG